MALGMAMGLAACGGGSTPPGPPPDCASVADTTHPASVMYGSDIAPLIALTPADLEIFRTWIVEGSR